MKKFGDEISKFLPPLPLGGALVSVAEPCRARRRIREWWQIIRKSDLEVSGYKYNETQWARNNFTSWFCVSATVKAIFYHHTLSQLNPTVRPFHTVREHFSSPLLQFAEKDAGKTFILIECPSKRLKSTSFSKNLNFDSCNFRWNGAAYISFDQWWNRRRYVRSAFHHSN